MSDWRVDGAGHRVLRWLNSAASGTDRLLVLIYHQVLPAPDPMRPDEIDRKRFLDQMRLLARHYNVLPLPEALRLRDAGRLPARAVAITFDDGYRNNLTEALPILESLGLTATFFIATGFLNGGRMWNDTVIEGFRRADGRLELPGLGVFTFDPRNPADRVAACRRCIDALKYRTIEERLRQARLIEEQVPGLPDDLMLDDEGVRALHRRGMTVGAHTVRHPILSMLEEDAAREEIVHSRHVLEHLLEVPVRLFAYPNGKPGRDYGPREVRLVAEAGFDAAFSSSPAACGARTSRYELPRFTLWDRTSLRFMARMARYYRKGREPDTP